MMDWLCADWPAPAGIVAGTTYRYGGVSDGPWRSFNLGAHVGDSNTAVSENRRRFRERCGLPDDPRWLQQVHGVTVVADPAAGAAPQADAVVTRAKGLVCAVLTADCLPVALTTRDGRVLGLAHAGWRGLAAGVLERTVAALDAPPGDMLAWLGPAISQPAFEVGDEVRDQFLALDDSADACFAQNPAGRWQADLYGLARLRLAAVGVKEVHGGARCTFGEPDAFFSYRRDGQCGRMATFIYRY
ncbi:MAG: peptidoglycan editing factor PgeF [Woeseia sp.]